jgi:murein L,D-transpeptidase YcbB/YkuD
MAIPNIMRKLPLRGFRLLALALITGSLEPGLPENIASGQSTLRELAAGGTLSELHRPDFPDYRVSVENFYGAVGYSLAWVHRGLPTTQAQVIIEVLKEANAKGLDTEDYDGSRWDARLALLRSETVRASEKDLARFDLALTVCLMRYVSDLHIGRVNPRLLHFEFDIEHKKYDLADLVRQHLVNASDVRAELDRVEPPFAAYWRTQKALQTYLALSREEACEPLPATRQPVQPGDPYEGTARLTRLLRRLGDLPPGAAIPPDSRYEGSLVDAVKRFQNRHGLDADGRIGKTTLEQLNTPLTRRVRQLQLTLERWRWIPHEFPRPPVVVNLPEFRLRALNDSYRTELEMKVVVGRAYGHRTPVFANEMKYLIFRPYWNVPSSIQRAELVPKLERNRSYLARNDYEIVTPGGQLVSSAVFTETILAQLRSGKLSIRQTPGETNALGLVKFMFPNDHNVYLHGTPAPELFSKSRRDFSHGCIRVEKPDALAAWILRDQLQWTRGRIAEAMHGRKTLQVNLEKPIPILIVYATAVVLESGEVHFFEDIYGHDAELEKLLAHGIRSDAVRTSQRPVAEE